MSEILLQNTYENEVMDKEVTIEVKNEIVNDFSNGGDEKKQNKFSEINSTPKTYSGDKVADAMPSTTNAASKTSNQKPKMAPKSFLKNSSLSDLVSSLRKKKSGSEEGKKCSLSGFSQNPLLTDSDLRKHIFDSSRDFEVMRSLRVITFTRAAFLGNFVLGLGVGTCLAVFVKVLYELCVKIIMA